METPERKQKDEIRRPTNRPTDLVHCSVWGWKSEPQWRISRNGRAFVRVPNRAFQRYRSCRWRFDAANRQHDRFASRWQAATRTRNRAARRWTNPTGRPGRPIGLALPKRTAIAVANAEPRRWLELSKREMGQRSASLNCSLGVMDGTDPTVGGCGAQQRGPTRWWPF